MDLLYFTTEHALPQAFFTCRGWRSWFILVFYVIILYNIICPLRIHDVNGRRTEIREHRPTEEDP